MQQVILWPYSLNVLQMKKTDVALIHVPEFESVALFNVTKVFFEFDFDTQSTR